MGRRCRAIEVADVAAEPTVLFRRRWNVLNTRVARSRLLVIGAGLIVALGFVTILLGIRILAYVTIGLAALTAIPPVRQRLEERTRKWADDGDKPRSETTD